MQEIIGVIRQEIAEFGQTVLSVSFSSVVGVITVLVYLILMPLLVFFFLKDKKLILNYLLGFFPRDRRLADTVWRDMDRQIANYVRGKFWEIIIVWGVSSFIFSCPRAAVRGVARRVGGSVCHHSVHRRCGGHFPGYSDRLVSMGLG